MSEKKEKENVNKQSKERKNLRLNLRITETENADLNWVSYNDDEPVSQVIRKAIKMYVNMKKNAF